MASYDLFDKLKGTEFNLGNGRVLRPGKFGKGWIQYLPDYMRDVFGGSVHYEIFNYYSGWRVALHDERGPRDNLWQKLKEIAEMHCLFKVRRNSEILLDRVVKQPRSSNEEADFLFVKERFCSCFKELDTILGFFLEQVLPVWGQDEKKGEKLVEAFKVPDDILTASDFMNKLVTELPSLDLGEGKLMKSHPKYGSAGPEGWKIFEGYLDENNVHFEVLVKECALSVELHDERGVPSDKLSRALAAKASKNHFDFTDGNVVNPCKIECFRDYNSILNDVCLRMGELWKVYGDLLKQVNEKGMDSIGKPVMQDLAPVPATQTNASAKFRKDIAEETLCWVTTIDDLFGKRIIKLSGSSEQMIAGNYIIPPYQRKYTWTPQNVNRLCRDLLRAANEKRQSYHLGTIILHSAKEDNDKNEFFVVDGQQRLRTISRLLSREIFSRGANLAQEKQFTDKDEELIWNTFQSFDGEDRNQILKLLRASTVVCIAVNDISESFQLFSTQNGRGKPLSPENLLKAYHLHEMKKSIEPQKPASDYDVEWEYENAEPADPDGRDGKMLHQVLGEHLYRIRCWLRGRFPEIAFSSKNINAFKGLTIEKNANLSQRIPLQNLSLLRRQGNIDDPNLAPRYMMDPYGFLDQPIVNGEEFFCYVKNSIRAYKNLFGRESDRDVDLLPFYEFYKNFSLLYPRARRRGDTYARHVFQSLCLYCYDRFGASGLNTCMRELYCCAYYERAVNTRCYYQSCGREFAVRAIQCMAECSSVADLKDRLSELFFEVINRYDARIEHLGGDFETVRSQFSKEEF